MTTPTIPAVDCLRVSVTDQCDLRCLYCRPIEDIASSTARRAILRFEDIVSLVRFLREHYGLRTVRLTGGEPLVRPNIVQLVAMLADVGLDDLAMTTNAQRLAELAGPLRRAGLHRINISLDSINPARYAHLTRGGRLDGALAGIQAAQVAGFRSVKLNTVVLRGENDPEVCNLLEFALARGLEIRFLELMAIGTASRQHAQWFVSSQEVIERLRTRFRVVALQDQDGDRTRPHWVEDSQGRAGRVGFISPETQPFCHGCRRLRLTAEGIVLGCLMHSTGLDLLPYLRRPEDPDLRGLDRAIQAALRSKPAMRERASPRLMAAIGG